MVDEMRTHGDSLLTSLGKWFKKSVVEKVPQWLCTRKLTYINLFSAVLVFISYFLARDYPGFLWLAIFAILIHGLADTLDGEIGRIRKEGYMRWGLYSDHFFDFLFFVAVVFGLYFYAARPELAIYFMLLLFVGSAIFIHAFLHHGATGVFIKAAMRMGPAEAAALIMILNVYLFFAGKALVQNKWFYIVLIVLGALGVIAAVAITQIKLVKLDQEAKVKKLSKKKKK